MNDSGIKMPPMGAAFAAASADIPAADEIPDLVININRPAATPMALR